MKLKLRIRFGANNISTFVQDYIEGTDITDVYNVKVSESGKYKKEPNGKVRPITIEEIVSFLPYKERRRREYPSVADQIDAIYKMALHLKSRGVSIGEEASAWVENVKKVKEDHPK
jgi:hypothetical protein